MVRWLVLSLVLAGCGTTTWNSAREGVRGKDRVVEAELALIAGDPNTAADLAEAALGAPSTAPTKRLRAFLALIVACDTLGALERPLAHLPGALHDALTLDAASEAEWIIAQAPRAWSRLDGQSAASPEVRAALLEVTRTTGDRWEPARSAAARELVTAERLLGGPPRAQAAARAAGFILDWRLSAPWGDAPLIDFDTPLPPETRPLQPTELTGAGWDLAPVPTTRDTFGDGEVTFFDLTAGGIGFAESTLEVQGDGLVVLRLEANRLARVFLSQGTSSREVLSRADLDGPWLSETTAALAPGTWRVTVKFATHDGRGFFRLQTSRRDAHPTAASPASTLRVGDGQAAISRLLALERRSARPLWDPRGAQQDLASLERALGPHPALDLLAARLALGDASTPQSERRELARTRYRAVLNRLPEHPAALRGLARLERDEQRPDAARELLSRSPADPRSQLELLDLLRSRGWEVESLALAEALTPLATASPRVSQELIDTWRAFGRFAEAQRAAEQLEIAFPGTGTDRLADLATDRGDPPAAALTRAWEAEPHRHATLRAAITAHRARGELDAAEALLTRFLEARPRDGWALGELARVALQRGDIPRAQARARAVLDAHPDFAAFESLNSQLARQPERFDALADGPALLADYRRFAASPVGKADEAYPFVTVYDRVEIDVRADGSTLEVSHRLRLVQSKQGADALGDVRPPEGARLLIARTLKRDGRLLEPERTEGKADLSFPELEPGDAVETAWVSRSRVSPAEGGYLTGISFAAYTPVHRLEARVSTAPGLDLIPTLFGAPPAPLRASTPAGGHTLSWSLDRIAATPREPLPLSARSFFPFADLRVVRAGQDDHGRAWAHIARAYASHLMRLSAPGPRVTAQAATLARAADPVTAAFDFVKRDMNDSEQLNTFDTAVEAALASKKGNRALVLYALLRALGDSELWLCAPERDGPPEDRAHPTPNANRFFYPIVVWRDARRTLHLDPARPYTPLGDLPAEVLGARCLAPLRHGSPAGPFADLPRLERPPTFELTVDLALSATGDARGTLTGAAQGAAASPLRQAFIAQDGERRRMIFEQWLGTVFTGAHLVDLRVEDAEASERPMRWTLTFEAPGLAHAEGAQLTLRGLHKALLAGDFAGVPELPQLASAPSRVTPLRILPYAEDLRVRVSPPPGYHLVSAPQDVDADLNGVTLSQRALVESEIITLTRRARLAPGRVEPSAYPAFRAAIAASLFGFESPLILAPKGP